MRSLCAFNLKFIFIEVMSFIIYTGLDVRDLLEKRHLDGIKVFFFINVSFKTRGITK